MRPAPLLRDDRAQTVRRALQALEPKQRMTAVLYYFNDMSVREIAQTMGCFEGTVKSRPLPCPSAAESKIGG